MEKKTGFFEEEPGQFSITRLLTFIIVVVPLAMLVVQAFRCDEIDWTGAISMISVGMLGKVSQKALEKKDK